MQGNRNSCKKIHALICEWIKMNKCTTATSFGHNVHADGAEIAFYSIFLCFLWLTIVDNIGRTSYNRLGFKKLIQM